MKLKEFFPHLQENEDIKIDSKGIAENEGMSLPSPNFFYAMHKILKNFLDEKAVEAGDRMSYFSAEFPLSSYFESYMRKQLEGSTLEEGFTPREGTVTINGEKNVYTSSYQGKTDNLEDFLVAIDNIPNTVKSVKVVDQEFKASDKEGIKSKVKELTTDDTDEFVIASFYGITKQDGDLDDPVYIDLKTPGSRQFGKDMAAGKYGSLD